MPEPFEPAKWDGQVLRGSIAEWDAQGTVIPKLPGCDLFSQGEWKVDHPPNLVEFDEVRLGHGPNVVPDLSLSLVVRAPTGASSLQEVEIGPLRVRRTETRGEVIVKSPPELMKLHHAAKSVFELRVTCPSRGLVPPPPPPAQWSAKGGIDSRFLSDYLSEIFQSAEPFDVRFSFPRSGQSLWANSNKLKQNSPYWKAELESGFKESQPVQVPSSTQSTYQPDSTQEDGNDLGWSDSDDEAAAEAPKPVRPQYLITVTDHSFDTYLAVLVWVWTKRIDFAAFRSTLSLANLSASADPNADSAPPTKRRKTSATACASGLAPIVSPKSVYRLADKLQMDVLREQALEAFRKGLTVGNAAHELFSSTAQAYGEVKAAAVEFVVRNWGEVRETEGMKAKLRQSAAGVVDHFAPIWTALAEKALAALEESKA